MRPEFVEIQNAFGYFLPKSFTFRSNEKQTKGSQRDLFLGPLQRLGRALDSRQLSEERYALRSKNPF